MYSIVIGVKFDLKKFGMVWLKGMAMRIKCFFWGITKIQTLSIHLICKSLFLWFTIYMKCQNFQPVKWSWFIYHAVCIEKNTIARNRSSVWSLRWLLSCTNCRKPHINLPILCLSRENCTLCYFTHTTALVQLYIPSYMYGRYTFVKDCLATKSFKIVGVLSKRHTEVNKISYQYSAVEYKQ